MPTFGSRPQRITPRLIAITDAATRGIDTSVLRFEELCARAAPGQIAIQLRDRQLSAMVRFQFGQRLAQACRRYGQYLVVSDRIDLAWLLGAVGVHLTGQSVSPRSVREAFAIRGLPCWVSQATHQELTQASSDALLISPVFAERKGRAALGTSALSAQSAATPEVLTYALGGVGPEECQRSLQAGASGVAAIGAVYDAPISVLSRLGILR